MKENTIFAAYKIKVVMGKGDKRTKKGKIWRGSYGNSRPQNVKPKDTTKQPKEDPKKK